MVNAGNVVVFWQAILENITENEYAFEQNTHTLHKIVEFILT